MLAKCSSLGQTRRGLPSYRKAAGLLVCCDQEIEQGEEAGAKFLPIRWLCKDPLCEQVHENVYVGLHVNVGMSFLPRNGMPGHTDDGDELDEMGL